MCDVRSSAWPCPGEREDKYHQSALSAVHQEDIARHLDLTLTISPFISLNALFMKVLSDNIFGSMGDVCDKVRIEVCNTTHSSCRDA